MVAGMITCPRKIPTDGEWLYSFRSMMQAADLETVSKATLAEQFGVCPNTLGNTLKRVGTSWLAEQQLERRRRFIASTSTGGIKSGANYIELLGFADAFNFYRWFKRTFGVAFKDWRLENMESKNAQ